VGKAFRENVESLAGEKSPSILERPGLEGGGKKKKKTNVAGRKTENNRHRCWGKTKSWQERFAEKRLAPGKKQINEENHMGKKTTALWREALGS